MERDRLRRHPVTATAATRQLRQYVFLDDLDYILYGQPCVTGYFLYGKAIVSQIHSHDSAPYQVAPLSAYGDAFPPGMVDAAGV
ncbi:MAG: hypothetical protein LBS79_10075, partial [Tannerella sp.]|nr:hypothetical protein [Tannerella sp.]